MYESVKSINVVIYIYILIFFYETYNKTKVYLLTLYGKDGNDLGAIEPHTSL